MSNKLEELTEKLYQEGLSKGRAEGEQILEQAKAEAETIIAKAKEEAEVIVAKAKRDADDLKSKAQSDIRMASSQCLQATKKDIENILVARISKNDCLEDPDFLKEIIKAVISRFTNETNGDGLSIVLPEKLESQLEPWAKGELSKAVSQGINSSFSKKIQGGFTIGPADGSWFISFTEETFNELICEYLRPVTRKILFG